MQCIVCALDKGQILTQVYDVLNSILVSYFCVVHCSITLLLFADN